LKTIAQKHLRVVVFWLERIPANRKAHLGSHLDEQCGLSIPGRSPKNLNFFGKIALQRIN